MSRTTCHESEMIPSQLPLVCGYVVTYNGKRFLERCFQTLQQLTDYENFRLILVDNGSADGSGDYVRENFPDVEILRIYPNVGYAGAANEAVKDARRRRAKYIVFSNDDIVILHSQWLREAVLNTERDPSIGMIGFVDTASEEGPHPTPELTLTDVPFPASVVYMTPVDLFDRIGMFDTVFFSNGEEDDLGARTQAAGYRLVQLDIPIFHFGSATNLKYKTRTVYIFMRNGIRFCLKNRGLMGALLRAVRILDVACNPWPVSFDADNGAHRGMRNSGNLPFNFLIWLRAVAWNIIHWPETYRIRAADRRLIHAARDARKEAGEGRREAYALPADNSPLETADVGV